MQSIPPGFEPYSVKGPFLFQFGFLSCSSKWFIVKLSIATERLNLPGVTVQQFCAYRCHACGA